MIARVCWYLLFACLALATPARASDLTDIDRTILKEPAYQSKNPQYCLAVFGVKAEARVWVVLDGDVLYVDRNGNGDLTEAGERIDAETALHRPKERPDVEVMRVFSITRGKPKLPSEKEAPPILSCAPDVTWFYVLQILPRDDWHDRAWAAQWSATPFDFAINTSANHGQRAQVRFGTRPDDAPIVHFNGPRWLALSDKFGPLTLRRGESTELTLMLTTPGLNSEVRLDHNEVPETIHPVVELELPPADAGAQPIRVRFELADRC